MKPFFIIVAIVALLSAGCKDKNDNPVMPANPTVSAVSPNTADIGAQNISGTITGTNLNGVSSINMGDGLRVEEIVGGNSGQVNFIFSVSNNAQPGARTVTVRTAAGAATSPAGAFSIRNNRVPEASFTVDPKEGGKNTLYTVDATESSDSDGSVRQYQWRFGDNKSATGRIATHKYNSSGMFDIELTVRDNDGATSTTTRTVEVKDGFAPVPRFVVTPDSGDVTTTFRFDASPSEDKDGSIVDYIWRFGDGRSAHGMIVDHKFPSSQVYSVELRVVDNTDLEASLAKDVRVEQFDFAAAEREIELVVDEFFRLYSKLETLEAEDIVVGWSTSPDCNGRDREIQIIEDHKLKVQSADAHIIPPQEIHIHDNHVTANDRVTAEFETLFNDGTMQTSIATHVFDMVFENGEWLICKFTLQ